MARNRVQREKIVGEKQRKFRVLENRRYSCYFRLVQDASMFFGSLNMDHEPLQDL